MWAPYLVVALIWTLPCACRICDKMQFVYRKLTPNGVKSKVDKSKFDWYKISKTFSVENLLK